RWRRWWRWRRRWRWRWRWRWWRRRRRTTDRVRHLQAIRDRSANAIAAVLVGDVVGNILNAFGGAQVAAGDVAVDDADVRTVLGEENLEARIAAEEVVGAPLDVERAVRRSPGRQRVDAIADGVCEEV